MFDDLFLIFVVIVLLAGEFLMIIYGFVYCLLFIVYCLRTAFGSWS